MLARQAIMFAQIVGFELRYHLRQPSTYVYFVIFGLLGWLVALVDARDCDRARDHECTDHACIDGAVLSASSACSSRLRSSPMRRCAINEPRWTN